MRKTVDAQKRKSEFNYPAKANPEELAIRYSLELEALDPVRGNHRSCQNTGGIAAGVKHMDAISLGLSN